MTDCVYLAMTAAEMERCTSLPHRLAYMACHFSPYGAGLSNFPEILPPGAILILNDRTPICGHDCEKIGEQLVQITQEFECSSILLDFQRPGEKETDTLCKHLVQSLPCPVGVSHLYAGKLSCPVFVPPLPLGETLSDHLSPWTGREIWLDMAEEAINYIITPESSIPMPCPPPQGDTMICEELHCRYQIHTFSNRAEFTLHRSRDRMIPLMEEASTLGVTKYIGLYQQLK